MEPVFLNFVFTFYCVSKNKDAKAHFSFFFKISIFLSATPIEHIGHLSSDFSQQLLDLEVLNFVYTFRKAKGIV